MRTRVEVNSVSIPVNSGSTLQFQFSSMLFNGEQIEFEDFDVDLNLSGIDPNPGAHGSLTQHCG